MERFEDLLELYLDNKEIKAKLEIDEKEAIEEENIKNNSSTHKFYNTITIKEFVNYYLGTQHECHNLKHKGLKSFHNPYVVGISNDFALKNPDCIIKNEIVVVIDAYGKPGTYINPDILKKLKKMEEYRRTLTLLEKIRLNNLDNIGQLYSKYTDVLEKIDNLEKVYSESCDLLMCLEKRHLLKELKKYAKKAVTINIELNEIQKDVDENLNLEYNVLNNIEHIYTNDEEEPEYNNSKVNRQKKFTRRSSRGTIRKDVRI